MLSARVLSRFANTTDRLSVNIVHRLRSVDRKAGICLLATRYVSPYVRPTSCSQPEIQQPARTSRWAEGSLRIAQYSTASGDGAISDPTDPGFIPLLLALPSPSPSLALEVLPNGVTIHRLLVHVNGKTHDIVIGPEQPSGHIAQKYTDPIIGRYANRVPVGAHTVSRHGFTATVHAEANETPEVSLHGGKVGWDSVKWRPLMDPTWSKLFTSAELTTIHSFVPSSCIFSRISEDGEQGYPGRLLVEVLVGLLQPQVSSASEGERSLGSVVIVYRATLLDKDTVTPINITQHWGFNLDASLQEGSETETVKEHKLKIKAPNTIAVSNLRPTIAFAPVAGTSHAHEEKTTGKIGERFPDGGYDDYYVFGSKPSESPTRVPAASLTPLSDLLKDIVATPASSEGVVELEGGRSGLRLSFSTNQSGVLFYSNNGSSPEETAKKQIHGGSGAKGDGYSAGSAAFLEFHEPPAAFLHPETLGPSGSDTLLASGELYNNFVRVDVWARKEGEK